MARKKKTSTSVDRSWRDLNQNVGAPTLSNIARKKYWSRVLRKLGYVSIFTLLVGASYLFSIYYLENREQLELELPSAKLTEVRYDTNGVLDAGWLGKNLGLAEETLMRELDVQSLRQKLLSDPQVKDVLVKKVFPDVLDVEIVEYLPVARIRLMIDSGKLRDFLVAENGYAFSGYGYSDRDVDQLPFLQNFVLEERGMKTYVRGMSVVSELIFACQLKLPQVYEGWKTIDLGSFDGRPSKPWNFIKVYSDQIDLLVFGSDSFEHQLSRLESILDEVDSNQSGNISSLNLSLEDDIVATMTSSIQRL